jgi:hypothetical protein
MSPNVTGRSDTFVFMQNQAVQINDDCSAQIPASIAIFWEIMDTRPRAPKGSPFQLPARLADGLGLESDPGKDFIAVRPGLDRVEDWFPRIRFQEGSRI